MRVLAVCAARVQDSHMHRAIVVLLTCLQPLALLAQSPSTPEAAPYISPAIGVHYGIPMQLSVAVGALIGSKRRNDGMIATVEPGRQGTEASIGYFRMRGQLGSGYSLRGAAIRTGDDPWNASPHTTYVGAEIHWMLLFGVGGRVGYFRRTSHSVSDPYDHIVSVGASIGA